MFRGMVVFVAVIAALVSSLSSPEYSAVAAPSSSSTSLVQNLYQDFLARSANPSEIEYWGSQLDQGNITQSQLAQQLSSSDEWIQTVIRGF